MQQQADWLGAVQVSKLFFNGVPGYDRAVSAAWTRLDGAKQAMKDVVLSGVSLYCDAAHGEISCAVCSTQPVFMLCGVRGGPFKEWWSVSGGVGGTLDKVAERNLKYTLYNSDGAKCLSVAVIYSSGGVLEWWRA